MGGRNVQVDKNYIGEILFDNNDSFGCFCMVW